MAYNVTLKSVHAQSHPDTDFGVHNGITITEVRKGFAKGEMDVLPYHSNPWKSIHGGVYFTMADYTAGTAAISNGLPCVTLNASVSYLRAGIKCTHLTCTTTEIKKGKKILVYEANITNQDDDLLFKGTFTFSVASFEPENMEIAPEGND